MANKDLDLKNLHELNDPLKYGLACLLIICILGLGYIFFFKDQLAELDVAKEKEISLKETFRQKSIQAANFFCVYGGFHETLYNHAFTTFN